MTETYISISRLKVLIIHGLAIHKGGNKKGNTFDLEFLKLVRAVGDDELSKQVAEIGSYLPLERTYIMGEHVNSVVFPQFALPHDRMPERHQSVDDWAQTTVLQEELRVS